MEVEEYLITSHMIERLYRRFLGMLGNLLESDRVRDITPAQAVVLFHIGEKDVTVGELVNRGYYLGSNPSYNVRKMVEAKYLIQEKSPEDKRLIRLKLSEKGLDLRHKLQTIFQNQTLELIPKLVSETELRQTNEILARLDRFWD